ncbi:hypothetical protein [Caulobacter soli]|uniref:hypothetical protein n=1 Tax=Caulobacter soli TaxID=2708539 RepID=UPI0013EB2020|nr:hypothetical protein [Caulobacter soli]
MTYKMNYDDGEARQTDLFAVDQQTRPIPENAYRAPRPGFQLPSIIRTGATVLMAGAVFFTAEILLPGNFKPSTLVGTYDARVAAAVKASEAQQQAKFEIYVGQVRLANDQNLERYRTQAQAISGYYTATYDRTKIYATGLTQLQHQYAGVLLQQTRETQSTDMSLVNMAKFLGRVGNIIEPGSGDSALQYADGLSQQLTAELNHAAQSGITVKVDGWDTNLPSPAEVQLALQELKPVPLPPPPQIWEDAPRQDFSKSKAH